MYMTTLYAVYSWQPVTTDPNRLRQLRTWISKVSAKFFPQLDRSIPDTWSLTGGGGVTSLLFPHNFVSTRFRIYLISWMHRFTVSLVVTPTLIILIFRPCQWLSQHNFCFKSPLSFSDYLELKSVTSCLVLIFAFLDFLHILRSDIVKS